MGGVGSAGFGAGGRGLGLGLLDLCTGQCTSRLDVSAPERSE